MSFASSDSNRRGFAILWAHQQMSNTETIATGSVLRTTCFISESNGASVADIGLWETTPQRVVGISA